MVRPRSGFQSAFILRFWFSARRNCARQLWRLHWGIVTCKNSLQEVNFGEKSFIKVCITKQIVSELCREQRVWSYSLRKHFKLTSLFLYISTASERNTHKGKYFSTHFHVTFLFCFKERTPCKHLMQTLICEAISLRGRTEHNFFLTKCKRYLHSSKRHVLYILGTFFKNRRAWTSCSF